MSALAARYVPGHLWTLAVAYANRHALTRLIGLSSLQLASDEATARALIAWVEAGEPPIMPMPRATAAMLARCDAAVCRHQWAPLHMGARQPWRDICKACGARSSVLYSSPPNWL